MVELVLGLHRPQLGAVGLLEHAADDELFLFKRKPVLRRILLCRDCVLFTFDIAPLALFGGSLDQLGEDVSTCGLEKASISSGLRPPTSGMMPWWTVTAATCLRMVFRSAIRGRFDERAGGPGALRCIAAVDWSRYQDDLFLDPERLLQARSL